MPIDFSFDMNEHLLALEAEANGTTVPEPQHETPPSVCVDTPIISARLRADMERDYWKQCCTIALAVIYEGSNKGEIPKSTAESLEIVLSDIGFDRFVKERVVFKVATRPIAR